MAFLFAAMITFDRMKKALLTLSLSLILNLAVQAQVEFSVGTGVSGLRNFSPQQGFWAIGQTVQTVFHFSPKQSAYAWVDYYTEGKFQNNFIATAKSPLASPQQLPYQATGRLTYRHFSLGWKHYFRGAYNANSDFNLYGLAGFGFLFAKVGNDFSTAVDTTIYHAQTIAGESNIKKLTFDLGIGSELPLGGNFFLFADARTWLPASSKISPYLHSEKNVPLPFMLSAGLRVLFGLSD